MRKLFALSLFLIPFGFVLASEATPSATPKPGLDKKVEDLKERLASKVAELSQTQRKAVAGTVKSITITTLVIESRNQDYKIELTDDIKVIDFVAGKRIKAKVDSLKIKDPVVIFGQFDTTLGVLKANVIVFQNILPRRVHGKVMSVDRKAATITIVTSEGMSFIIDVEKGTKTNHWIGQDNVEKSGFSKIVEGDFIHVIGSDVAKKDNRVMAQRILNLSDLSGTGPTPTPAPTDKPTPTPKPSATPKVSNPPAGGPTATPEP